MKSDKKIAVFGCKSTSKYLIDFLHPLIGVDYLITIDPVMGRRFQVADYLELAPCARKKGIEVYEAEKYSLKAAEDTRVIAGFKIDIAFVAGWQRLIPERVLDSIKTGAFGMHGSAMNLPLGRGRSPMNWSILEGRKVFYTNLFKYNAAADAGEILDTVKFSINGRDTGETLHFKNTLAMKFLINKNIEALLQGKYQLLPQRAVAPSYYPKRTPADSLIDWEEDLFNIERLIRAVTRPFNGAYSFIDGKKIILYQAQVFDLFEFGHDNQAPGAVVEVFANGKFLVKGIGGLLLVHEYEYSGEIGKGLILNKEKERKKYFRFNRYGFHDLFEDGLSL